MLIWILSGMVLTECMTFPHIPVSILLFIYTIFLYYHYHNPSGLPTPLLAFSYSTTCLVTIKLPIIDWYDSRWCNMARDLGWCRYVLHRCPELPRICTRINISWWLPITFPHVLSRVLCHQYKRRNTLPIPHMDSYYKIMIVGSSALHLLVYLIPPLKTKRFSVLYTSTTLMSLHLLVNTVPVLGIKRSHPLLIIHSLYHVHAWITG